jgi:GrpB-like predicted nucleotidyltransferase (UPF0157 family)
MALHLIPYNPNWPIQFESIAATLRPDLAHIPCATIEQHVGSAAIPGLAAKPVIDIDVIIDPAGIAAEPALDMAAYITRKSPILQTILAESDLTPAERAAIFAINNP